MKKIADYFFSTRAAGLYMILFALAIAIATFVEKWFWDFRSSKNYFQSEVVWIITRAFWSMFDSKYAKI